MEELLGTLLVSKRFERPASTPLLLSRPTQQLLMLDQPSFLSHSHGSVAMPEPTASPESQELVLARPSPERNVTQQQQPPSPSPPRRPASAGWPVTGGEGAVTQNAPTARSPTRETTTPLLPTAVTRGPRVGAANGPGVITEGSVRSLHERPSRAPVRGLDGCYVLLYLADPTTTTSSWTAARESHPTEETGEVGCGPDSALCPGRAARRSSSPLPPCASHEGSPAATTQPRRPQTGSTTRPQTPLHTTSTDPAGRATVTLSPTTLALFTGEVGTRGSIAQSRTPLLSASRAPVRHRCTERALLVFYGLLLRQLHAAAHAETAMADPTRCSSRVAVLELRYTPVLHGRTPQQLLQPLTTAPAHPTAAPLPNSSALRGSTGTVVVPAAVGGATSETAKTLVDAAAAAPVPVDITAPSHPEPRDKESLETSAREPVGSHAALATTTSTTTTTMTPWGGDRDGSAGCLRRLLMTDCDDAVSLEGFFFDEELQSSACYGGWWCLASGEAYRRVLRRYDVRAWPAVLLLDPAGNLVTDDALTRLESELAVTRSQLPPVLPIRPDLPPLPHPVPCTTHDNSPDHVPNTAREIASRPCEADAALVHTPPHGTDTPQCASPPEPAAVPPLTDPTTAVRATSSSAAPHHTPTTARYVEPDVTPIVEMNEECTTPCRSHEVAAHTDSPSTPDPHPCWSAARWTQHDTPPPHDEVDLGVVASPSADPNRDDAVAWLRAVPFCSAFPWRRPTPTWTGGGVCDVATAVARLDANDDDDGCGTEQWCNTATLVLLLFGADWHPSTRETVRLLRQVLCMTPGATLDDTAAATTTTCEEGRTDVVVVYVSADTTPAALHAILAELPSTWLCVSPLLWRADGAAAQAAQQLRQGAMEEYGVDCLPRLVVLRAAATADASSSRRRWDVVESHAERQLARAVQEATPLLPTWLTPSEPDASNNDTAASLPRFVTPPRPLTTPSERDRALPALLEIGGYFVVLCALGPVQARLHAQCAHALHEASVQIARELEKMRQHLVDAPTRPIPPPLSSSLLLPTAATTPSSAETSSVRGVLAPCPVPPTPSTALYTGYYVSHPSSCAVARGSPSRSGRAAAAKEEAGSGLRGPLSAHEYALRSHSPLLGHGGSLATTFAEFGTTAGGGRPSSGEGAARLPIVRFYDAVYTKEEKKVDGSPEDVDDTAAWTASEKPASRASRSPSAVKSPLSSASSSSSSTRLDQTEEVCEAYADSLALLQEYILAPIIEQDERQLPPREGELFLACVRLPQRSTGVLRRRLPSDTATGSNNATSHTETAGAAKQAPVAPSSTSTDPGNFPAVTNALSNTATTSSNLEGSLKDTATTVPSELDPMPLTSPDVIRQFVWDQLFCSTES